MNVNGPHRRDFLAASCGLAAAGLLPNLGSSSSAREVNRDILGTTAVEVAARLRGKKISATELLELALAHIRKIHPRVNAVVAFRDEQARREAAEADALIAKGKVDWQEKPLTGVPITVKDCLHVAGLATTSGVPKYQHAVARKDATVVKRLRDAGAIIIGKTNLPALMSAYETGNTLFGVTRNPHDGCHTSGGSSGGEAAVVASGGSWLGVGTDSLGSIRVPAHYCGVFGLRPGWGRLSRAGQMPPVQQGEGALPDPGLTTTGPIARSVDDLQLALSLMQGPDPRDPNTFPVKLRNYRDVELAGLTVAFWTDSSGAILTPETERTLAAARRALEKRGVTLKDAKPPLADRIYDISQALYAPFFLADWEQILKDHGVAELGPIDRDMLKGLGNWRARYTDEDVKRFQSLLPKLKVGLLTFLQDFDAIISPVTATPAPRHATTFTDIRRLVFAQLPAYVPAIPSGSVPCGFSEAGDGSNPLPIGVQVIGRQYREDTVLAVMQALEDDPGGWRPPPSLS